MLEQKNKDNEIKNDQILEIERLINKIFGGPDKLFKTNKWKNDIKELFPRPHDQ